MSASPSLTLHVLPPSHPSKAAEEAIRFKGLEYEKVDLNPGEHNAAMEEIYGEGHRTVPGLVVDGEPVHGSRAILAKLEEIAPDPPLYPAPIAEQVREAERWGDDELQQLGRDLAWGALHFRPEAMGTVAGGEPLDPAGTDFAIKYVRASWKYHGITAVRTRRGPRRPAREARPRRRARRRRDHRRRLADRRRPADRLDPPRPAHPR